MKNWGGGRPQLKIWKILIFWVSQENERNNFRTFPNFELNFRISLKKLKKTFITNKFVHPSQHLLFCTGLPYLFLLTKREKNAQTLAPGVTHVTLLPCPGCCCFCCCCCCCCYYCCCNMFLSELAFSLPIFIRSILTQNRCGNDSLSTIFEP